jgi:hypothetical protein
MIMAYLNVVTVYNHLHKWFISSCHANWVWLDLGRQNFRSTGDSRQSRSPINVTKPVVLDWTNRIKCDYIPPWPSEHVIYMTCALVKQAAHSPPTHAASNGFWCQLKKRALPPGVLPLRQDAFLPRLAASISNGLILRGDRRVLPQGVAQQPRVCAQHAARHGVKYRLMPHELAASVLPALGKANYI